MSVLSGVLGAGFVTSIPARGPFKLKREDGSYWDVWYDRYTRSWVVQLKDDEGNQFGPLHDGSAAYSHSREEALDVIAEGGPPTPEKDTAPRSYRLKFVSPLKGVSVEKLKLKRIAPGTYEVKYGGSVYSIEGHYESAEEARGYGGGMRWNVIKDGEWLDLPFAPYSTKREAVEALQEHLRS